MSDLMTDQCQIPANPKKSQDSKRVRILLADDHLIVRQGLCCLLQLETDFEVVGEAENGLQAIELARQCHPEVVIMDIDMPIMNGIEATSILAKEMPQVKIVALSMHIEKDAALRICDAGATAYLTKGCPTEELVTTIRACQTKPPKDM
jgi:DNA-binding NarL/FixJ family response regulator